MAMAKSARRTTTSGGLRVRVLVLGRALGGQRAGLADEGGALLLHGDENPAADREGIGHEPRVANWHRETQRGSGDPEYGRAPHVLLAGHGPAEDVGLPEARLLQELTGSHDV